MTDSARQSEYEKVRDQHPMYSPGYTAGTWFNAGWNGAAREIVRNLRERAQKHENQVAADTLLHAAAQIERVYGVTP